MLATLENAVLPRFGGEVGLVRHCAPAELPQPWDDLDVAPSSLHCPGDHEAVLEELQGKFERRDLLNSGVVVRTRSGELRLCRYLREPSNYLVVLRQKEGGLPLELITELGCVSGNDWPAIASLKDFKIREQLAEAQDRLLLVFGMQDLVVCLSLGIATSLVVGMEEGLDLVDDLAERCGWDARERQCYRGIVTAEEIASEAERLQSQLDQRLAAMDAAVAAEAEVNLEEDDSQEGTPESTTDADVAPTTEPSATHETPQSLPPLGRLKPQPSLSIVLLGWRPAELSASEPDDLAPLVERLKTIDEFIGIQMTTEVDIWSPDPRNIQIAETRLEFGVVDGAADALRDNFDEHALSICYFGREPSEGPRNFGEAAAHLRHVLRDDSPRSRPYEDAVQEALASFEALLDRDIATPLAEAGAASADPVKKTNFLLAAELARLLHRQIAIVDFRMERVAQRMTELRDLSQEFADVKGSIALVDRFINVAKVLAK
ncbi:MAG: hypothetical protein CMJ50_08310 [Planctomycetaceae bacterium]|nr:hypothetical protein [Planctomycetaceae bacterium]